MKKTLSIFLILFGFLTSQAQDKPAYTLYNAKGKKVKYKKMIKDLKDSDMVFFGEYHTDPIAHWLQFEVTKSLYEVKGDSLFLGAEMFENGNQLVLNEYLAGLYAEKKMLPEITQLWKNYNTDYKPLVEFAKENNLRFIATNIPRRYASMINKGGFEALDKLSPEAKEMIGPQLVDLYDPTAKAYADMKEMMGNHAPPNMGNIMKAQAAKDATMAHFSLVNYKAGDMLIHYQGSYHSNYNEGIIWWINKIKPGLDIKSIATVYESEWEELSDEDKEQIANYIIVVAEGMTQTSR